MLTFYSKLEAPTDSERTATITLLAFQVGSSVEFPKMGHSLFWRCFVQQSHLKRKHLWTVHSTIFYKLVVSNEGKLWIICLTRALPDYCVRAQLVWAWNTNGFTLLPNISSTPYTVGRPLSRYFWQVPPAVGLILQLLCSPTGNRNFGKITKQKHHEWRVAPQCR